MAFFKFRFSGQEDQAHHNNDAPHESLDVLRKRVKHRLIGSGVLVLIAVIGFPLVFDTQPRPVGLDVPIDIPDKAKTSLNVPPTPLKSDKKAVLAEKAQDLEPSKGTADAPTPSANLPAAAGVAASAVAPANVSAPAAPTSTPPSSSFASSSTSSPPSSAGASSQARHVETKPSTVNARSTLDAKEEIVTPAKTPASPGKSASAETSSGQKEERYVIQVGAYSDEQKVRDIREKLEKAGLHTYTQVVDKEGKKTRIRIGPFTSKEDANRQLQKVKSLNLQPNLLTL